MNYINEIDRLEFPEMVKIDYGIPCSKVIDVRQEVRNQLSQKGIMTNICKGMNIAVAVGSRGIDNLYDIVQETCDELKKMGANPFIVPAMGSHGGACEDGQRGILAEYGITESRLDVPIHSSMEVVEIGYINNMPVYFSKDAIDADAIVLINRIKSHTNFRGEIESGLVKMLTVGLGKHKGALEIHRSGFEKMGDLLLSIAPLILEKTTVAFGLGITENIYNETNRIIAIPGNKILEMEPGILQQTKDQHARIPFTAIDVLIVDEIGKEISGDGMDPMIIGRNFWGLKPDPSGPVIQRIAVLGLSEKTHGNAVGIGYADVTTEKLVNSIDYNSLYTNCITATSPLICKIPITVKNDRQAIEVALRLCIGIEPSKARIVRIRNTSRFNQMYISVPLIDEALRNSDVRLMEEPKPIGFMEDGNLVPCNL